MKILILGGDGMLGHQLLSSLKDHHEVRVTLRQDLGAYTQYGLFNHSNSYAGIDIRRSDDLLTTLNHFKPNAVINAVGIVKQRKDAKDIIPSLEINALFPHRLALLCEAIQARLVHISTDCIFSGQKGAYTEKDRSDAEDLYGVSKYLGEVSGPNAITLRTSIIGLELTRKTSLIEWFLAQEGAIKGFRKAIYSGFTTLELSRIIERILLHYPTLSGVWHISSNPINKHELLNIFSTQLQRKNIQIEPNDTFVCDRSLLSDPLQKVIDYTPPTWHNMLSELATQAKERAR